MLKFCAHKFSTSEYQTKQKNILKKTRKNGFKKRALFQLYEYIVEIKKSDQIKIQKKTTKKKIHREWRNCTQQ